MTWLLSHWKIKPDAKSVLKRDFPGGRVTEARHSLSLLLLEPTFSTDLGLEEEYVCTNDSGYKQNIHVQIKTR